MQQHVYMYSGAVLEQCLAEFIAALLLDINMKDIIATDEVNDMVDSIRANVQEI